MAQNINNAPSQTNSTGTSGANGSDDAIASMEAAFDRAIAKAAEVTERRMEGGSALDAARTRLSN
jgi:hypothetical protein